MIEIQNDGAKVAVLTSGDAVRGTGVRAVVTLQWVRCDSGECQEERSHVVASLESTAVSLTISTGKTIRVITHNHYLDRTCGTATSLDTAVVKLYYIIKYRVKS